MKLKCKPGLDLGIHNFVKTLEITPGDTERSLNEEGSGHRAAVKADRAAKSETMAALQERTRRGGRGNYARRLVESGRQSPYVGDRMDASTGVVAPAVDPDILSTPPPEMDASRSGPFACRGRENELLSAEPCRPLEIDISRNSLQRSLQK